MSERKGKLTKPPPGFTARRSEIAKAAIADPRIEPTHLRLFLFVLHRTDHRDNGAIVQDELIMSVVRGFAVQSTIYRARKALAELGWWTYQPGSGLAATVYEPRYDNVAAIKSKVKADEDRVAVDRERRKKARARGKETLQSQHKAIRESRRKTGKGSMQIATQACCADAGITPSPSPSGRVSTERVQDMALSVQAPKPVRASVPEPAHIPDTEEIPTCCHCRLLRRIVPAVFRKRATGDFYCSKHGGWGEGVFEPIPIPTKPCRSI